MVKKMKNISINKLKDFCSENTGFIIRLDDIAENMNWDIEQALRRVHKSNMSKLGDDGKPIKREDGKVLKGPNYQPPDLSDLV